MKKIYLIILTMLSTTVFAQPSVTITPTHKECVYEKRCELIVNYNVTVPNDTDANQNIEIHYIIRGVGIDVKEYKRIIRRFVVGAHSTFSENYVNRLNVVFEDTTRVRHFTFGGIDIKTNGALTYQAAQEETIYYHDKN